MPKAAQDATFHRPSPTGEASPFSGDEIIVTKTDLAGRISYANSVFLRVSALTLERTLGRPHSIIRHPDMPRSLFHRMWETLRDGREFFGFIQNLAQDGRHYWVFAHVTPSLTLAGAPAGYHSSRRQPRPGQVSAIADLYQAVLREERAADTAAEACAAGHRHLDAVLGRAGTSYDAFVFSL